MPLGLFHDRVVDRGGRDRLVEVERHVEAGEIAGRSRESSLRRTPDVRPELLERIPHRAGAKQEDAGVPVEIAAGDDSVRRSRDRASRRSARRRRTCAAAGDLDVAIAGFRLVRLDAEDHDPAFERGRHALLDGPPELLVGRNFVVGGNDQHHRIAMRRQRLQRGDRHRRRRVPPDRLEDRAAAGHIDLAEVGVHARGMPLRRRSGRSASHLPAAPPAAAASSPASSRRRQGRGTASDCPRATAATAASRRRRSSRS